MSGKLDEKLSEKSSDPGEILRRMATLQKDHEETIEKYKRVELEKNKSIGQKNFATKEKDEALKRLQSAYDELNEMDQKLERKDEELADSKRKLADIVKLIEKLRAERKGRQGVNEEHKE